MRRWAILLTAVLLTAACGGGEDTSSAPPPSTTSSSSASTAPDPVDASADGKATCDFLRGVLPQLEAVGSPVGALAQLAGAYFSFVAQSTPSKQPDSRELDTLTTRECPDARSAVLQVLGVDSFEGNL